MRVVFVLHSTGLSGGVKVVLEIANRFAGGGHDVHIFALDQGPSWFRNQVQVSTFSDYGSLGHALASTSALKVATFWRTAAAVARNSSPGEGFYLVQDIETCYEEPAAHRAVLETYTMPLTKMTTSRWVAARLQALGEKVRHLGVAIEHDVFNATDPAHHGRTVLVNAPRSPHIGELKGTSALTEILRHVRIKDPTLSIISYSPEAVGLDVSPPYRHFHLPNDSTVASLFQSSSCFLITSRHEGFCLPALEAMACGCPVISTSADGNDEFCIPDSTCLSLGTVRPDVAADRVLDLLNTRRKLELLRANGIRMAGHYRWERVLDRLADIFQCASRDQHASEGT